MLQTHAKSPSSRTIRSNSLNVPDGAVALSIQIPSNGTLRKGSICSCSRCSFASETERPRSGMTESTIYSDAESSKLSWEFFCYENISRESKVWWWVFENIDAKKATMKNK